MVVAKFSLLLVIVFILMFVDVDAEPKSSRVKSKSKGGRFPTSPARFPPNFGRGPQRSTPNGRKRISPQRPSSSCSRSRSGHCTPGRFNNQPVRRIAPLCGGRRGRRSSRCSPNRPRPTRRPATVTTRRPLQTYRSSTIRPIHSTIPPLSSPSSPVLSPLHVSSLPTLSQPTLVIDTHDPQNFAYGVGGQMIHPDQLAGHQPSHHSSPDTTVELSSGGSSPAWIPYGGEFGCH